MGVVFIFIYVSTASYDLGVASKIQYKLDLRMVDFLIAEIGAFIQADRRIWLNPLG